ncbi:putative tyrosyl-DNA phosphodiesterase [Cladophialophora carrionii]|uniref:Putative tyrosyl-DNA phosphodiesterase n=1 Tax=Cladophialophora carrionii TaxID=86049 RepID=A0A1C1CQR4_9EURO|nr:putative tyrosyl-DNA phosphodiesterase [Cladophialophora carrionii]
MDSRPSKRVKLASNSEPDGRVALEDADPASIRARRAAFLSSISRSISPPAIARSGTTPQLSQTTTATPKTAAAAAAAKSQDLKARAFTLTSSKHVSADRVSEDAELPAQVNLIASPFKLTKIRDLPSSQNIDTVSIDDILGNPLIKEAWVFNYCFDVDWFMNFFDSDVRNQVQVKVIHGSWKNDSPAKQAIDDACRRWENVTATTAYLPDQFGTHHSKMIILFTHDDLARVVIHTANMLAQDWTNLTQAAWISPMLPLMKTHAGTVVGNIGSGSRFKHDLQAYLAAYGSKTKALRDQLALFDFGSVRGALIASVPSHMKDFSTTGDTKQLWDQKLWGYPSLFRALGSILPEQPKEISSPSHVVCQISSIATLPPAWLNQFFPILHGPLAAGSSHQREQEQRQWDPSRVSIIYPTPRNVASSLNGYASGGSIHMKAQSAAHLKQIASLRQSLCQWTQGSKEALRAGRAEAAPHIKTFVCFSSKPTKESPTPDIRWALLTSANLSQQAWGTLREVAKGKQGKQREKHKEREVVVQSYEIGVLVWPELFAKDFDTGEVKAESEGGKMGETELGTERQQSANVTSTGTSKRQERPDTVRMIPVFGKDEPSVTATVPSSNITIVGLRLPYDLPLTPYSGTDMPWSPQGVYEQRDRHGRRWPRDFL